MSNTIVIKDRIYGFLGALSDDKRYRFTFINPDGKDLDVIFRAMDIHEAVAIKLKYHRKKNPSLIGDIMSDTFAQLYFTETPVGEFVYATIEEIE